MPNSINDVLDDDLSRILPSQRTLVLTNEGVTVTGTITITDRAGNSASQTTVAVKIDKTSPVTTHVASLSGTQATVTLSPSDNLSGVAATCYTINGGAAQSYSGPFNVNGAGSYTITYYSTDGADNTEPIKTASFTITTGPVTITLLANKVIAWCAARQWAIRRGEVGCDSGRASWSRLWMVDKEARRRAGRASAILLSGRSEWESESGSSACVGV